MIILILFAFLAGVVTILSPCILPVLPIILSSSAASGKKHPLGVVSGFVISFTFFTLFLTLIVKLTGLSADFLRNLSVVIILLFGLVLVIPKLQLFFEIFANKFSARFSTKNDQSEGFGGGFLLGISLGLIWTPCVGPILAAVISLAITGSVSGQAALITLAYSMGTALPMLAIIYGGRGIIAKVPGLTRNLGKIQKVFGVLMILTAAAIFFNYDRKFQTYILEKFPNYGVGLTQLEDNALIRGELDKLGEKMSEFDLSGAQAPELIPGGEWFNSEPLTLASLKGRVVLVDFWTYSCINCIRTLPYLRSWHEKYSDKGLTIIGVHTPEFEFEKDAGNLAEAIQDFELAYPIVQDNNYETWRAYKNRYWPAKYFIDHEGQLRATHFGEGEYDESEETIRKLLQEAGYELDDAKVQNEQYRTYSRTPETYLGYSRIENFASPEKIKKNTLTTYSYPEKLGKNEIAYKGDFVFEDEKALPKQGASLSINFESKEVFLVMNPVSETAGEVQVYLDGDLVTEFAGKDVKDGMVKVTEDRLYRLIDLPSPGSHILELKFNDDNTEIYAFTFG